MTNGCEKAAGGMPSDCAVRFTQVDDRQKTLKQDVDQMTGKLDQIHHILCGNGEEGMGEQIRAITKEQAYQNDAIEDLKAKLTNQIWSWWQKVLAVIVVCATLGTLAIRILTISGTK